MQQYDQLQEQNEKLQETMNSGVNNNFGQDRLAKIKSSLDYLKVSPLKLTKA